MIGKENQVHLPILSTDFLVFIFVNRGELSLGFLQVAL